MQAIVQASRPFYSVTQTVCKESDLEFVIWKHKQYRNHAELAYIMVVDHLWMLGALWALIGWVLLRL